MPKSPFTNHNQGLAEDVLIWIAYHGTVEDNPLLRSYDWASDLGLKADGGPEPDFIVATMGGGTRIKITAEVLPD